MSDKSEEKGIQDIFISGQISGLQVFARALEGDEVLPFELVKELLERGIKGLERDLNGEVH